MTQVQLPAHLQGRVPTGMAARAAEGMGSSLPPHISIQGNAYTFIDASGNEAPPMLTFDGYIVDVSDVLCKRYYDKDFEQNAQTYEPPACWSSNGIGPSREAPKPQAQTCEMCPHNVRGSKISKVSGASIKACRDERWIAVINPSFGPMVFQLVIPPGSFTNWKGFVKQLENYRVEPSWVLTRFAFQPKTNGVQEFTIVNYTAPEAMAVIDTAIAERKTDAIVGRLDQPRTAAIAGAVAGSNVTTGQTVGSVMGAVPASTGAPMMIPDPRFGALAPVAPAVPAHGFQQPTQEVIPPGASQQGFTPPVGFGAQPAANQPTGMAPAFGQGPHSAQGASPSEAAPQPPQRRRRRTAAEMAAASAPGQTGAPAAPQGGSVGFQPPQAPFAPAAAPQAFAPAQSAPQPSGNTFGIQSGAPVNPELSQMLTNLFPNGPR